MYLPSGISCSSAELRRFSSRCSWMPRANIDGVSTAMKSSCSDAISLLGRGSLDDLGRHDDHPVLPGALGVVQRRIGRRDKLAQVTAVRDGREAEARRETKLPAVRGDEALIGDDRTHALGEPQAACDAGSGEHDRKLVAAPAAGDVALTDRRPKRVRDAAQCLVAAQVPVAGVHVLEAVEIGEHDADVAAETPDSRQLETQRVLEAASVREPGQAVDERLLLN